MTTKSLYGAIAAVCLSFTLTGAAFAQSCVSNSGSISAPNAPTGIAGNNCNHITSVPNNICSNGDTLNGAGIDIYSLVLGAGNNFSVTVTSSAFQPELALTGNTTCSSNSPCVIDQTTAAAATAPYSVTGTASALAAGTYFLFVGDVGVDSPGCGAYNLAISPTLPVELKNFSVD